MADHNKAPQESEQELEQQPNSVNIDPSKQEAVDQSADFSKEEKYPPSSSANADLALPCKSLAPNAGHLTAQPDAEPVLSLKKEFPAKQHQEELPSQAKNAPLPKPIQKEFSRRQNEVPTKQTDKQNEQQQKGIPLPNSDDVPLARPTLPKPTRPLTAYHMFFQLEREWIIQSTTSSNEEDNLKVENDKRPIGKEIDDDMPFGYRYIHLNLNWFKSGSGKRLSAGVGSIVGSNTSASSSDNLDPQQHQQLLIKHHQASSPLPKRKHRKTHGKISFLDLSRRIAARWAELQEIDPTTKEYVSKIAKRELGLYKKDMKWYKAHVGKAKGSAKESAGNSIEGSSKPAVVPSTPTVTNSTATPVISTPVTSSSAAAAASKPSKTRSPASTADAISKSISSAPSTPLHKESAASDSATKSLPSHVPSFNPVTPISNTEGVALCSFIPDSKAEESEKEVDVGVSVTEGSATAAPKTVPQFSLTGEESEDRYHQNKPKIEKEMEQENTKQPTKRPTQKATKKAEQKTANETVQTTPNNDASNANDSPPEFSFYPVPSSKVPSFSSFAKKSRKRKRFNRRNSSRSGSDEGSCRHRSKRLDARSISPLPHLPFQENTPMMWRNERIYSQQHSSRSLGSLEECKVDTAPSSRRDNDLVSSQQNSSRSLGYLEECKVESSRNTSHGDDHGSGYYRGDSYRSGRDVDFPSRNSPRNTSDGPLELDRDIHSFLSIIQRDERHRGEMYGSEFEHRRRVISHHNFNMPLRPAPPPHSSRNHGGGYGRDHVQHGGTGFHHGNYSSHGFHGSYGGSYSSLYNVQDQISPSQMPSQVLTKDDAEGLMKALSEEVDE